MSEITKIQDDLLKEILQFITDNKISLTDLNIDNNNKSNSTNKQISDDINKILEKYTITKKSSSESPTLTNSPPSSDSPSPGDSPKLEVPQKSISVSSSVSRSSSPSWAELDDYDDYRHLSSSAPPEYKSHSDDQNNKDKNQVKEKKSVKGKEKVSDDEKNSNRNSKRTNDNRNSDNRNSDNRNSDNRNSDNQNGERDNSLSSESNFKKIFIRIPSIQTKFSSDTHIYSINSSILANKIQVKSDLNKYSNSENMDNLSEEELLNWYSDRKKLHEYQCLYVMGDYIYTTEVLTEI